MMKQVICDQLCRDMAMGKEARPGRSLGDTISTTDKWVGRYRDRQHGQKVPVIFHPVQRVLHWACCCAMGGLAVAAAVACTPMYQKAQEMEARPPKVSYDFSSDAGLVDANSKARNYCGQYASTPSLRGSITDNPDGTRSVTFECIKTAAVTPYPRSSPPPMSYSYRTDTELLQAIDSADAYCAQYGQITSSSIVTNADGTKTLTYQCIPR